MTDADKIAKLQYALREDARYEAELIEAMIEKFGHDAYVVYCNVTSEKGANYDGSDPLYGLNAEGDFSAMGTRGLIGFKVDGKYVGTYNHFDSYPSGLGRDLVRFINAHMHSQANRRKLADQVKALTWVQESQHASPELQKRYASFANTRVSTQKVSEWYCLLRQAQGVEGIEAVYDGRLEHMIDSMGFAKDSLFCEWAYFLNLEESKLEIFQGFQRKPHAGNPFGEALAEDDGKYYAIAPVDAPAFADLSEQYMEELEQRCSADE